MTSNDDILKARQMGVSTYIVVRYFYEVTTQEGKCAVIICHEPALTTHLREVIHTVYDNLPAGMLPKPQFDREGLFSFKEMGSQIYIGTVKKGGFGLGMTIHYLLGTEYGHKEWGPKADDIWKDLKGAVPPNGWKVRESSAYGLGGPWYSAWLEDKKGLGAKPWFFPWWYAEEYRIEPAIAGDEWTAEERALPLDGEQIAFRREKQKDLGDKFPQVYAENDVDCFLAAGNNVFDVGILREMGRNLKEPILVSDNGALKIWELPKDGKLYVAGSDVGEGDPGGNFSGTGILDWESGEQVASLYGRWPAHIFAVKSAVLCRRYNNALWGVERAGHGSVVLDTASRQLEYSNLFIDSDGKLGWNTTRKTRPTLIEDLGFAIREQSITPNDENFIRECFTFVRTDKKPDGEAQEGCFDDSVFTWGISWQMRKYARHPSKPVVLKDRIAKPKGVE